uniref:Uncharacterized protein n=1 Tax=Molossus molossus TaxID=27622 RepID=A0A7J8IZD4_MOLMO|nr:hypothetical protein HJG59_010363 [Molossus molossus]
MSPPGVLLLLWVPALPRRLPFSVLRMLFWGTAKPAFTCQSSQVLCAKWGAGCPPQLWICFFTCDLSDNRTELLCLAESLTETTSLAPVCCLCPRRTPPGSVQEGQNASSVHPPFCMCKSAPHQTLQTHCMHKDMSLSVGPLGTDRVPALGVWEAGGTVSQRACQPSKRPLLSDMVLLAPHGCKK